MFEPCRSAFASRGDGACIVAFAGIVVDLDGSATEGVGLESSYYGSGIFSTGDIDETVGWVTAGERIDGHV